MARLSDAAFLDALDDLIVEDILNMPADELRAEVIAEGGDPDAMAAEAMAAFERALAAAVGRAPCGLRDIPVSREVD